MTRRFYYGHHINTLYRKRIKARIDGRAFPVRGKVVFVSMALGNFWLLVDRKLTFICGRGVNRREKS